MSSSGRDIFITQSKTICNDSTDIDTDNVLSDVLDIQENQVMSFPKFDLEHTLYSDISDGNAKPDEKPSTSRFAEPLHQSDLKKLVSTGLCQQTEQKAKWAVNLFVKWSNQRPNLPCKHLLQMTLKEMNEYLSYFIAEIRNVSGNEYKPNTLYEIIVSIQHFLRQNGIFVRFLDDTEFQGLRNVLDAKMKDLSRKGIGLERKQADIITEQEEDILWNKGLLGESNPQTLLDTLVYQFGLHFALRAGKEHRNLRVGRFSQLSLGTDSNNRRYIQYTEDVSKTNRGGLNHRRVEPKVTRAYENRQCLKRCPVQLYEKYINLRPKEGKCDAFYLRPKKTMNSDVWYCDSPIGIHTLQQTIKRLCLAAGFHGNYTNHSLRATAATRLYAAGIDEQLIAEKTGHRSSAIRAYKRTSDNQQSDLSHILCGEKRPKLEAPRQQNPQQNPESSVSNNGEITIKAKDPQQNPESSSSNNREITIKAKDLSIHVKF